MATAILVAFDDSEQSNRALEHALSIDPDAEITVLHVLDPSDLYTYGGMEGGAMVDYDRIQRQREEAAEQLLDEARSIAADADYSGELKTETRMGNVPRTVITYADEADIDHIVVGSHGRSGASRILLGSVAERIVRRAPVPVTVVR